MAKRKKARRSRKRAANPKRRHHRRKAAANPKRRRARARAANPRRVHRRRRRAHAANPRRHRRVRRANPRRHHRRARRNPESKPWMKTLVAAAIGAVTMGVVSAGAYAVTQRRDPSMASLQKTSQIAAALAIVAGIWWAKKKSALQGAAVATAGAALLVSTKIAGIVGSAISKPTSPAMAAVYGNMGAYARQMGAYSPQMGAYARQMGHVGAVYGNVNGLGAVYGNVSGMGALGPKGGFVPRPNWVGNPF